MKRLLTILILLAAGTSEAAELIATHRVTYDRGESSYFASMGLIMYSPGYALVGQEREYYVTLAVNDWAEYHTNPPLDPYRNRPYAIGPGDIGTTFTVAGLKYAATPYPVVFNSDWPLLVDAVRDVWSNDLREIRLAGPNSISGNNGSYQVLDYSDIVGLWTEPEVAKVQTFPAANPTLERIDYTLERWDRYIVWRSNWYATVAVPEPASITLVSIAVAVVLAGRRRFRG